MIAAKALRSLDTVVCSTVEYYVATTVPGRTSQESTFSSCCNVVNLVARLSVDNTRYPYSHFGLASEVSCGAQWWGFVNDIYVVISSLVNHTTKASPGQQTFRILREST
jgi:hypothetical protein